MSRQFSLLLDRIHEIHDLQKAADLLAWDRQVIMPEAGDEVRVHQITTLRRLAHVMFTDDNVGELIEDAALAIDGAAYESNEASLIRYLRETYDEERRLPVGSAQPGDSLPRSRLPPCPCPAR